MHVSAAQILGTHHLSSSGFDQRRTGQEDRTLILYDDRDVRHRRNICSACCTRAHHHGDLGNTLRAHPRLIIENPPKMVAIREHFVLIGQVRAAGVHQIDAGQIAFLGNFLGAQVLFHGHRVIGPALHRRIVADHHHLTAMHLPHTGNHPRRWRRTVVKPMGRQSAHFQKWRTRIQQIRHPTARQHFAPAFVACARGLSAPKARHFRCLFYRVQRRQMCRTICAKLVGTGHNF